MKTLILLSIVLLLATVGASCIESEEAEELLEKVEDIKTEIEEAMEEDVASTPPGESEDLEETSTTGDKTVVVWVRAGVRNATMNGGNPLGVGQDNTVTIMVNHPLWVEFDYTDSYGRDQHTRIDLDDYYDFFILHENGSWTQLKYRDAYEDEKDAPAS